MDWFLYDRDLCHEKYNGVKRDFGEFLGMAQREKHSLIYKCSLSSEKTKVIQIAGLGRILTCLYRTQDESFFKKTV